MRRVSTKILAITLAVVIASPVYAQRQRGQRQGQGFQQSGLALLDNVSVQKELKMTDDQIKAKIQEEFGQD